MKSAGHHHPAISASFLLSSSLPPSPLLAGWSTSLPHLPSPTPSLSPLPTQRRAQSRSSISPLLTPSSPLQRQGRAGRKGAKEGGSGRGGRTRDKGSLLEQVKVVFNTAGRLLGSRGHNAWNVSGTKYLHIRGRWVFPHMSPLFIAV